MDYPDHLPHPQTTNEIGHPVGNDRNWHEDYLDRLDSLCIDIRDGGRVGLDPPNDPQVRWRLSVDNYGGQRDEPATQLLEALVTSDGYTQHHLLSDRRNYHSWGASGASHQILIHLAVLAGDEALLAALRRIARHVRRPPDGVLGDVRSVDRSEAEERARWHVMEMFELAPESADALTIRSEARSLLDDTWCIQLESADSIYEVELEATGYAMLLRVQRSGLPQR